MTDWLIVTANTYRNLFMAFETISHDSGGGAGHDNYSVHPAWRDQLPLAEAALSTLTGDRAPVGAPPPEGQPDPYLDGDFCTFCIGEQNAMMAIAARSEALTMTSALLCSFFEGWATGPDGGELA